MKASGLGCKLRSVVVPFALLLASGAVLGGCKAAFAKGRERSADAAIRVTLPFVSKYSPKYADTLTDPVLRRAFSEVFRKDPDAITPEEYRRVRGIRFETVDWFLVRMDVSLQDGSKVQVPIVNNGEGITLDGNSFQAFPNLETLDMSGQRSLLHVTFSSQEYANTLANLEQLRCLYLPDSGDYPGSPAGLAYMVANPGAMEELGGVTFYATADVEKLVRTFPNLRKLRIVRRELGVSLSGLQECKELRALYTPLRRAGNEDLLALTGVRDMELIASEGDENIEDFRFLSGLTELEQLTLRDAVALRNLNDMKPLTKLRELRLSGATQLTSIEPLRALTALETLDLGNSFNLSDYAALYELPQLKRLRISDGWQAGRFIPDVTLIPALEELECSAETLPQLARCRKLKKLTLFLSHFDSKTDFSGLARLSELEELTLNVESATQNTEMLYALRELPKLRKVTFCCKEGTVPLHAFPAVTELTVLGEDAGSGGSHAELQIRAETEADAPALERLSVYAHNKVRFEGWRSTTLRELRLGRCGIDTLSFMEAFPNLELLDLSDNRVEDIAALTALPKLRYLCYTDNVIQNIALLKNRGIVLVE